MKKNNKHFILLLFLTLSLSAHAISITNTASGSWYDTNIWDSGRVPATFDKVTIKAGTNVTVYGQYTDCDSLIINGFLDVGPTNLTIGGRELYIDDRAIRNTVCIINGGLRINGDWSTQFKVYGSVKFNTGSTLDMLAGQMMIDGCGFKEELSVTAEKALLDVTDAAYVNTTGGVINMFNAHYHPNGLTIKGAKHFFNVSFGNNLTLANFAQRHTSDFLISETDKPTFESVRIAYLPNPNRQNRVVLNDVSITGNLDVSNGVLVGTGRFKVKGNLLIAANGRIETDIECNGAWQQNITSYLGNTSTIIKGNFYINNPNLVQTNLNLDIQNGTIHLMQGKFDLTNKTLALSSAPSNANGTRYIVTQSGGALVVKNISGSTLFPVGTYSDYLPVTLSAASGDFSVAARPLSISPNLGSFAINAQWDISRLKGNALADIQVQWNSANESADFAAHRSNSRIHHYNGNSWQPLGSNILVMANATFLNSAQSINEFSSFTVLTQSVVPVTLKNFGVKKDKNESVLLSWQTVSEFNNAGFEIEKSSDGIAFDNIGYVKGARNTFEAQFYQFVDKNFSNTAYYRLKQVDLDGKFSFSNIVSLQFEASKKEIKVYPNPIIQQPYLTIESDFLSNNPKIEILDINGRIIYQNNPVNAHSLHIAAENWSKGLYIIRLTTGDKTLLTKFIKQ